MNTNIKNQSTINSHNSEVTVVMPLYNPEIFFLKKALASICAQNVLPYEVIFVIDSKIDQSIQEILDSFSLRHKIITNVTNMGQGFSRNCGIKLASTKWVAFLDQDDLWLPNHLLENLAAIQKDEYSFVYSSIGEIDLKENITIDSINHLHAQLFHNTPMKNTLIAALASDMMVFPTSAIISREKAMSVGGFAPHLRGYEDDYLFLHLFARHGTYLHIQKTTCYWRSHDTNSSHNGTMDASRLLYLKDLLNEFSYNENFRDTIAVRFTRNALGLLRKDRFSAAFYGRVSNLKDTLQIITEFGGQVPFRVKIVSKVKSRYIFRCIVFFHEKFKS